MLTQNTTEDNTTAPGPEREPVVGERVAAILSAEGGKIYLLGYGVYEGRFEPPAGYGGLPWEVCDAIVKARAEQCGIPVPPRPTNPRLRLDDGWVVWGLECWWGPEDEFKQELESHKAEIEVVRVTGQDWRHPLFRQHEEIQ